MTAGVYLLHFSPPYKHAKHYMGFAEDIDRRIEQHRAGTGARLTQVAIDAGCRLILARIWPGADRSTERRLKKRKESPRLCPICGEDHGAQLELLLSFTLADVEELEF